jgi:phage shock protein C
VANFRKIPQGADNSKNATSVGIFRRQYQLNQTRSNVMSNEKRLYRSRDDRMIGGVCAGLGKYLNLDPTVVRLIFVLGAFFGMGSLVVVYLILLLVIPEEPMDTPTE